MNQRRWPIAVGLMLLLPSLNYDFDILMYFFSINVNRLTLQMSFTRFLMIANNSLKKFMIRDAL